MQTLTEQEALKKIAKAECFEAQIEDGAFTLKILEYSFFIATAIHNGERLREDLKAQCALSDDERRYEEDPNTADFISSMPITFVANDSRYEYDLNRSQEQAFYESAWGKTVWIAKPDDTQKQLSLQKHTMFYTLLSALVKKIEALHGSCLVYDIHSYNYQRNNLENAPVFNIGSAQIAKPKYEHVIGHWNRTLSKLRLPNITVHSAVDEVFEGRGYLAQFVKERFKRTLVLPTEIKKVYMDEKSGDLYPLVMEALKTGMKDAMLKTALYFSKTYTRKNFYKKNRLLSSQIEPSILKVDKALYNLAKNIEILLYINPKNLLGEKKRFFAKNYNYEPKFTYHQLDIDPYEFREKLYRLPVDDISDVSIQKLYRDVIDSYAQKIDLLSTIGSEKFLYNSLRYFGEPSVDDIQTSQFILYAKAFETYEEPHIDAKAIRSAFYDALGCYEIDCKVEITDKIVASAMVNNVKKSIQINRLARMNTRELLGLIEHELGVHMVTTLNSEQQALRIFRLGLPKNTMTQEGLAILSEILSGNMQLHRMKSLALRVIAVKMMIDTHDFSYTFGSLMEDYAMERNAAFQLTARVFRGGGFTKDYLYLNGIKQAIASNKQRDLTPLFVGKTSFEYLDVINEMIERDIVARPTYLPRAFKSKITCLNNPIMNYLIEAIC